MTKNIVFLKIFNDIPDAWLVRFQEKNFAIFINVFPANYNVFTMLCYC